MPALPTVTNTVRIDLEFSDGTDTHIGTRFFFSYSGSSPSNTDCTNFAATAFSAASSNLMPQAHNDVALIGATCTDLNTTSGGQGIHSGSTAGSGGTTILPAGACFLINYEIARRYRGGKPRSYMPIGTGGDLTNPGAWSTGAVSAVTTAVINFIAALVGATEGSTTLAAHVNVSYYSGVNTSTPPWRGPGFRYPPKLRTGPITPDLITSVAANQKPGSQRRRYQR